MTQPQPYNHFDLRPMAGALGADIDGVDLASLDDAGLADIKRAFADYLVLQFHDQKLTPEQHVILTKRFGPTSRSPYIKHMDEHPDIIAVLKEADEARISTFGNAWHSDFSFLEEPPLDLARREHPDAVRVDQHFREHHRVVRRVAPLLGLVGHHPGLDPVGKQRHALAAVEVPGSILSLDHGVLHSPLGKPDSFSACVHLSCASS